MCRNVQRKETPGPQQMARFPTLGKLGKMSEHHCSRITPAPITTIYSVPITGRHSSQLLLPIFQGYTNIVPKTSHPTLTEQIQSGVQPHQVTVDQMCER